MALTPTDVHVQPPSPPPRIYPSPASPCPCRNRAHAATRPGCIPRPCRRRLSNVRTMGRAPLSIRILFFSLFSFQSDALHGFAWAWACLGLGGAASFGCALGRFSVLYYVWSGIHAVADVGGCVDTTRAHIPNPPHTLRPAPPSIPPPFSVGGWTAGGGGA